MQQPPYPAQPYGMPPQGQSPKKRNTLLIVLGVVGGSLLAVCVICSLAIALAGRGAGTTTTSGNDTTGNTGTTSTAQGPAKVGSTITVDSVGCTLVSAAVWNSGNEFITPKAGNEFVKVTVKLHNGGSSEVSYNEFDFHAKSSTGNITDPEIASTNNDLGSGHLSAGGTAQGDIVFQVPQGDHGAELTWQPSFFGNSDEHAWLLGV